MIDRPVLFDRLRRSKLMGPTLSSGEVKGVEAILNAAECYPSLGAARIAYMLATPYHETNGTMEPISEYGSNAYFTRMYDINGIKPVRARDMGNVHPGDGIKYRGRGLVQLTWFVNYLRAGEKLKLDLVNNPDLAMQLGIAAQIMVVGMVEGWFTGVKVSKLPLGRKATSSEFVQARSIINGRDRAELIAGYASTFQDYLIEAGCKL